MDNVYTISIARADRGEVLAAATVEVADDRAWITEIRAEVDAGAVPPQLGAIDFSLLVRTVLMVADMAEPEPRQDVAEEPRTGELVADSPAADPPVPVVQNGTRNAGVPSDFAVTYWRLGSLAKVAKRYDVPNHIAQEWIKLLQQEGKVANPWPKKGVRPFR
ncbi:hypothetical protein [Nocardia gipuzkoensis]